MTKEESSVKGDSKPAAERVASDKERSGRRGPKKEKVKPPKKIVIRHLPPTMTEEEFLKQIDPLPQHDFYYYAAADWSLGFDATCRAYLTLKHYDDVFLFRDRFDGYVFVDSKGAEYPAIVEFAPFQGLLKNKSRRTDNKMNSIEQEAHYQQFLAKLEEDREAAAKGGECKLEFSLDRKKEEKITSTPLLQYLANKKEKRREEAKKRTEEKRRQREEEKEKRRQAQQQQQVTKIISGQEGGKGSGSGAGAGGGAGGGGGGGSSKSASGKENVAGGEKGSQQQQEERKNARSKRREERNQRRREQFVARKKERERERQEGGEAREKGNSSDGKQGDKTDGDVKSPAEQQSKQSDDGKQSGKESKRYSERRERERERNQNRRDNKEKQKEKEREKEKDKQKSVENQDEDNESAAAAYGGISDSVLNFIRSVVAKEFVPKHKQQEQEQEHREQEHDEETKPPDTEAEPRKTNKNAAAQEKAGEDRRTQKQRAADEQRRIRNKDRPSIAIYQPKARMRLSEERDTVGGKSEMRSNPTSDCESVKKEETRSSGGGKKVSRYSERRAERRNNREKQKLDSESLEGKGDSHLDDKPHPRELRKSKSCENESSTKHAEQAVEQETAQSGEN